MKKVDMVIEMQFGSTGKGLIAGYLAEKYGHDVVLTANMPNAGHTYINATGRKWVHKALPSGITSPSRMPSTIARRMRGSRPNRRRRGVAALASAAGLGEPGELEEEVIGVRSTRGRGAAGAG